MPAAKPFSPNAIRSGAVITAKVTRSSSESTASGRVERLGHDRVDAARELCERVGQADRAGRCEADAPRGDQERGLADQDRLAAVHDERPGEAEVVPHAGPLEPELEPVRAGAYGH